MWQKEYKKWLSYEDLDVHLREAILDKNAVNISSIFIEFPCLFYTYA